MNYYLVAPTKVFRQNSDQLTYQSEEDLNSGHIVLIPLGKKTIPGIVIKQVNKPNFKTRPITKVIYQTPLPGHLVKAAFWLKQYYATPLPIILQSLLPSGIDKKRRKSSIINHPNQKTTKVPLPLNADQKRAIKDIQSNPNSTVLLHGITGSGKTNIYIKLAQDKFNNNQSVILLVPEIALTSQLVIDFQAHFDDVFLIHSQQTESERHKTWEQILNSQKPKIIIGPRSALFAPVNNLGLIIIDECHEPSYHQDQSPKYSALRLASFIIKSINQSDKKLLLGSATPLAQDYYLAQQKHAIVELTQLAKKSEKHSTISLIDFKNRQNFTKHHIFSNELLESISNSLKQNLQTLIFHNRRGSAPLTICEKCGWQALCPNCYLPLTLHSDQFKLVCHTCGYTKNVPISCPQCKHANIVHKGFGTKYIEEELKRLFPNAQIARFDADTPSEHQLRTIYQEVKAGNYDILIGTQTIAKGFDFPKLKTLGIIQADSQLSLPDFSSEERTYQLINQVIGRANRGHQDGEIFIQTFQPSSPVIQSALKSDYKKFYEYVLNQRHKAQLPPYVYLLKLSLTYKTESIAVKNIKQLKNKINAIIRNNDSYINTIVSQPAPAFHEHSSQGYTWQIIIKAKSRQNLTALLSQLPPNPHLHFQLDPPTLL